MRIIVTAALALGLCLAATGAGEEKTVKILLIAKDRDHAFSQHEYLSDCTILAKCLGQTRGVQAEVPMVGRAIPPSSRESRPSSLTRAWGAASFLTPW